MMRILRWRRGGTGWREASPRFDLCSLLNGPARSVASIVAAVAALLSAFPSLASPPTATVITPLQVQPDVNNVSIGEGLIRVDVPALAIPAAPRLRFSSLQDAVPYLRANLSSGPGYVESSVAVHTGASSSERFSCIFDDVCSNVKASGATIDGGLALGGPYSFTESRSGAVYAFDTLQFDSGYASGSRQVWYYATSITYPDGEVISFTYDKSPTSGVGVVTHHRLARMSSNIGYHIDFAYEGTNDNLPSWHWLRQATLYRSAAPTAPLARLTYAASGTITDLAGRVFTCAGCRNGIRAPVAWANVSLTLPTEAATHLATTTIAAPGQPDGIVASVVRAGVTWFYSYTNLRAAPAPKTYTYDSVVVTGPAGYQATYAINPTITTGPNLIASAADALGRTTSYTYDNFYRPTRVTYPEGNWVQIAYDNFGNFTSKVAQPKPGSGLSAITESTTIDASACNLNRVLCFRPTSHTDGLGRTTNFAYDGAGRLIQRTDPPDNMGVRRATFYTYGGSFTAPTQVRICGLGTTCGTSAEIVTNFTYWGATALPLTETRVDGATGQSLTTTYSYDEAGRLLSEDGPLPGTGDAKYYRYDVLGWKTWEIGPANAGGTRPATRTSYRDSDDKVIAVETGTLPDPTSTALTVLTRQDILFDAKRYPVRTSTTAGGTVQQVQSASFDDRGQQVCSTVRMNPAAFGSLPASACTLGTQGTHGPDRVTRNIYDAAGRLLQVRHAVGTPLQQNYATYLYSPNGKQTRVTDANGNRADLRYDGHDRLVRWFSRRRRAQAR